MANFPMSTKVMEYEGSWVVSISLPSAFYTLNDAMLDLKEWQTLTQQYGYKWHVNRAGEVQRGGVPTKPDYGGLLMANAIMQPADCQQVIFVGAIPRDYRRVNLAVVPIRHMPARSQFISGNYSAINNRRR